MLAQLSDFKPDADSDTPLYMQLANKLSDGIADGDWRANEALPSERVLSEMLTSPASPPARRSTCCATAAC